MGCSAPGSPDPKHPAAGAVPGWHASREPAASTLARGSGLVSHFPCIMHLNNNKKAIGLKFAGITRRSGDVSMCKRLIKIETRATSTDANYLGWQIKGSSFPAEGFITCLAKGAERKGRGLAGGGCGSTGGVPAPGSPRTVVPGDGEGSSGVGLSGTAAKGSVWRGLRGQEWGEGCGDAQHQDWRTPAGFGHAMVGIWRVVLAGFFGRRRVVMGKGRTEVSFQKRC